MENKTILILNGAWSPPHKAMLKTNHRENKDASQIEYFNILKKEIKDKFTNVTINVKTI